METQQLRTPTHLFWLRPAYRDRGPRPVALSPKGSTIVY